MNKQPNCEKPRCNGLQEKTYTGENGNKLRLCEKHYYNLVANGSNTTVNIDSTEPVMPFWDSGVRCDTSNTDLGKINGHPKIRNLSE